MALFPKEGTNLQPRQTIQSPKKKKAIFHPIDFLSPPTAIRYFHLGQTHLALTFSPQHEDGETTTGTPGLFQRMGGKHGFLLANEAEGIQFIDLLVENLCKQGKGTKDGPPPKKQDTTKSVKSHLLATLKIAKLITD